MATRKTTPSVSLDTFEELLDRALFTVQLRGQPLTDDELTEFGLSPMPRLKHPSRVTVEHLARLRQVTSRPLREREARALCLIGHNLRCGARDCGSYGATWTPNPFRRGDHFALCLIHDGEYRVAKSGFDAAQRVFNQTLARLSSQR